MQAVCSSPTSVQEAAAALSPFVAGAYPISMVAALTGLDASGLRRWIGGGAHSEPVVQPSYGQRQNGRWLVSFLDLVELKIVGELRRHGVSLSQIRQAHSKGRELLAVQHPLASREVRTDGTRVFIHHRETLMDLGSKQYVLEKVVAPFLVELDYDETSNLACRWRVATGIVLDPTRSLGHPTLEDCHIMTAVLHESYLAWGESEIDVAEAFNISPAQVLRAVKFEQGLRRAA